jgi:AAA+ ATPase superfamily predicted ATPase
MNTEYINREHEVSIMRGLIKSEKSQFLALYGRRRIGKTYLIEKVYEQEMVFHFTGIKDATIEEQLEHFNNTYFAKTKIRIPNPKNWIQALELIKDYIDTLDATTKKVIFIDELPWIASPRSNFLNVLDSFWNGWANKRNDIVLVICGSAASWIIDKILNNKSGLHNRVTQIIRLLPFSIGETKKYLESRNIYFDDYSAAELYMAIGGIPFYLTFVQKGESVHQTIDRICFQKDGFLKTEITNLYASLFKNSEKHLAIVEALSKSHKGLTRTQIIKTAKLETGGTLTKIFKELTESGFVSEQSSQGKKSKEIIYRLEDEYTLFYFRFMKNVNKTNVGTWQAIRTTKSYETWCGYAFENLCIRHINAVRVALGISGLNSVTNSWLYKGDGEDAQIDLLIDRADRCVNICEIKFCVNDFEINKSYAQNLDKKIRIYKQKQGVRKTVLLTMITPYGLKRNEHAINLVASEVRLQDLFVQKNL